MSNINPNNINGSYPVAGVDNDSQGFRDNFTNILNNFATAAAELTDLQSKVIVKQALTGTTLNNNMAGTLFSSAEIRDLRETEFTNAISTNVTLDHTTGHYQVVTTNGNTSITFTNFPTSGKVGRVRLKLVVAASTHRLYLPSSVSASASSSLQYIHEYNLNTNSIGFTQGGAGTYYFEFLSDDGGTTYAMFDLTRARNNTDYTYANVSNGTAASPNASTLTSKLIIDSTNGLQLANISVTFPSYPLDGQYVAITSNVNISNLFLISANTILGNTTTLTTGSHLGYTYVGSPSNPTINKWIRTQV